MGLYEENIPVPHYDPDTGVNVKLAEQEDKEISKLVQAGLDVEAMAGTQGWKFVEKWLNDNVRFFSEKLRTEEDYEKIRRFQEAVKCYQSLLTFKEFIIHEARVLNEQRQENQTPKAG